MASKLYSCKSATVDQFVYQVNIKKEWLLIEFGVNVMGENSTTIPTEGSMENPAQI